MWRRTQIGEPAKLLQPLGDVFMSRIRMCVIPVVFVSLVCGIASLSDLATMRRVAWKSIAIYMLLMSVTAVLAMSAASVFEIGKEFDLPAVADISMLAQPTSLKDALMSAIPPNRYAQVVC